MFLEFLYPLVEYFSALNVFKYLTFRSAYAAVTALLIAFLFGPRIIERLRVMKFGQSIRADGPESHHAKSGTPTMGGILIVLSVAVSVLLWGDLKNGRTVHSLAFGLARFGAKIVSMAAPGFELPEHVTRRLKQDYGCEPITAREFGERRLHNAPVDAAYIAPEKPHQRTLFTNVGAETAGELRERGPAGLKLDALYVTRLQRERLQAPEGNASGSSTEAGSPDRYDVVNTQFLRENLDAHSSVMHPLPRVEELATEIDTDERAVYFKQAAYGVPVRMALLAAVLGVRPGTLSAKPPDHLYPVTLPTGIACRNPRCITGNEAERRYLRPTFSRLFVDRKVVLRCVYCEHEQVPGWVAISPELAVPNRDLAQLPDPHLAVFETEQQAVSAGFRTAAG